MEWILDLSLIIISILFLVTFGAFALVSWKEKEKRAARIASGFAITIGGMFLIATTLNLELKMGVFGLIGFGLFIIFILLVLPVGKVRVGNDLPRIRYDERDIMFARSRLVPGSPEYQMYYEMRPGKKAIDDNIRSKPGLLSPHAKLANKFLFASPNASFTLTEALHEVVDGPVAKEQLSLPLDQMTSFIKGLAWYYGALDVGVTELKSYHVYSHIGRGSGTYGAPIPTDHTYAIAFTVEMDHNMVGANPAPPGVMESARQYVEAARVAVQLAATIRNLGYKARAHIDGDYRVILPLVARDAGLGEIGRMGLLMTPRQGPRVRLGAVTTTLELEHSSRSSGESVIDFCSVCTKCAENCPSKSIPFNARQEIDGTLRWRINPESCYSYWNIIGTDCGICMTVCPFSHPDSFFHNLIRWGIERSGYFRRAALWLDNLFYGKKPQSRSLPGWIQVR